MADSNPYTRDDLVMYMGKDNQFQIIDIIPKYNIAGGQLDYERARGLPHEGVDMYIYWSQERMEGHGWTRKK